MKESTENKEISKCCGAKKTYNSLGECCFNCLKPFEPAELNLASQDWEEELKTAIKIFKVEGLTEHQLFLYVKDLLSLARTEEAIKCSNHCSEAVAEYKAELVKLLQAQKVDAIQIKDEKRVAFNGLLDDIINLIISPNKE